VIRGDVALGSILDDRIARVVAPPDAPMPVLEPAEAALVATAVHKRQREFALGRWCARAALAELGATSGPILSGEQREPLWPPGIVGSITHCDGFCAAAVAWSRDFSGLGIDAELAGPLPAGTPELILNPSERHWLRDQPDLGKVCFSAKESVFKCIAPLTGLFLEFSDVTLVIEPPASFIARITLAACTIRTVHGRFTTSRGFVLTSATLPA
jgi:4'-phosphopantetheinyl transferase EntD